MNNIVLYPLIQRWKNFTMYIRIAEGACSSLPKLIIQNHIFKGFRIKKKNFPKKSYYEL